MEDLPISEPGIIIREKNPDGDVVWEKILQKEELTVVKKVRQWPDLKVCDSVF